MSFAWPWMLLLALVPAAGFVLQRVIVRRDGGGDPLPSVIRATAWGGRIRADARGSGVPWRIWLGALLLVVALGRPQWGARPDSSGQRPQIVIALDLSRSMLAKDALPSRIERARTIATRLVAQSPTSDIGLIGFAGQAYLLAAPSADRALLRAFLPAVEPDQMVVPGSNFASLLGIALHAYDPRAASRTLVLLSDGEAEPTPWRPLLQQLRGKGIHVVAVGLGTAAGAHLRIGGHDVAGPSGTAVISRLEADDMREIGRLTGGAYLDASQSFDLTGRVHAIAEAAAAPGRLRPGALREDRFAWFLAPALLLLLWSALVEWPALPRLLRAPRRWTKPAAYASAAMLVVALAGPRGQAVKPPPISLELHGTEPDPLLVVKDRTAKMLAEGAPTADDFWALAQAAVRYGEVHRQHAHVLQEGVMRDGLVAIGAGSALDPQRPGWTEARAKLIRLLRPPKPVDNSGKESADPANDPIDAQKNMPTPVPDPGKDQKDGKDGKKNDDQKAQDSRKVGGAQRSKAEEAEWHVPSLVKPLYTLQKLRSTDRPGELFRLMQLQQPISPRAGGQTW